MSNAMQSTKQLLEETAVELRKLQEIMPELVTREEEWLRVSERLYRAVIALPGRIPLELCEAIEELYRHAGQQWPRP